MFCNDATNASTCGLQENSFLKPPLLKTQIFQDVLCVGFPISWPFKS